MPNFELPPLSNGSRENGSCEYDYMDMHEYANDAIQPYNNRIIELEAELAAWKERFPKYEYRPQDDCVALKLGE